MPAICSILAKQLFSASTVMLKITANLYLVLIFTSFISYSQHESPGTINVSGYLDLYYLYDFSKPATGQRQYVTQAARHNELNLNLGLIKISYENENIRGNLGLQAGTYAIANYAAEPDRFAQLINQANIGIRIGKKTWVDAGVLSGHFGYEGLLSMNNELYTHALVTEYTPYFQTGVQLSHQISEKVSFKAVVLNGWQIIAETNIQKSIGFGLDYQLTDDLKLSLGNYIGKDPSNGVNLNRYHQNGYLALNKSNYKMAAVVDYMLAGWGENPNGNTDYVLFLTYIYEMVLNENWKAASRFEYVVDQGNILFNTGGGGFQTMSVAACLSRSITENVLFRVEGRHFFGNENIWIMENGTENNTTALSLGLSMRIN